MIWGEIPSMTAKKETTIGKQREMMYKEFIKLYVKLVPPLKAESDKNKDTQEGFIMSLIKADNVLKLNEGKPETIIDVDVNTP